MAPFFNKKKHRYILKLCVAVALLAWLLIQVAASALTAFDAPRWIMQVVAFIIILCIPVALFFSPLSASITEILRATGDIDNSDSNASTSGQMLNYVIGGLLILTVTFLVNDNHVPAKGVSTKKIFTVEKTPVVASENQLTAIETMEQSIAVLPFEDKSPDKDQGYLADGTSEELLNSLIRIPGLKVAGRTSSFYFKGRKEDLKTIGEMLGVELILRGSTIKNGNQIGVSAELIKAKSGQRVWTKSYNEAFAKLFAIQDDIVRSIMQNTGGWSHVPGMTQNVKAYNEYLQGQATRVTTPAGLRTRIEHLEQAVKLDPDFANAWQNLSSLYRWAENAVPGNALIPDSKKKADQALERARELTPDSPYVLVAMAYNNLSKGAWLKAGRLYRDTLTATGYAPEYYAYTWYALFLMESGRAREAVKYFERIRAVDSLNVDNAVYLLDAYASAGDIPAALGEADRLKNLKGAQVVLKVEALMAALGSDDRAEIDKRLALLAAARKNYNSNHVKMGRLLDDPATALAQLHKMAGSQKLSTPARTSIAQWAAYYGDSEFALNVLREILPAEKVDSISSVIWRPVFRKVRKLEGFRTLLDDIGLVDYWRTSGDWGDFCQPVGEKNFKCE